MDSLTHIALGATIGEIALGKKIGNKAMLYGAIIGSIPDIDVIFTPFIEPTKAVIFHRGISHSILVASILVPIIAYTLSKFDKINNINFKDWAVFTLLTYSSHIFIDCFNTYGTGIFEPFSNYRVAYDAMAIIDIFFLFPLLLFIIWALFVAYKKKIRRIFASISLLTSSLILVFSIINKEAITQKAINQLELQGIKYCRLITTPAPLSNFLWTIVAEDEDGFWLGYLANFNKTEKVNFRHISRNSDYIIGIEETTQIRNIKRFSKGFYSVEKDSIGKIWMHDLRYASLDFDNERSYVFSFGISKENGEVKVTRAHPNRRINANTIRRYFEVVF